MKFKWCSNQGMAILSIQIHTHTYTLAHTDEHLIQNGPFSQCSKAITITARVGILIIQSIVQQYSVVPLANVPNGPLIIMQYSNTSSTGLQR